ncbi:hypothetical protein Baya_8631 [Bagarius yarrelli]|uniref:Taste receptor type 2 n=1 Tax=Bagarius yarrelli TaxID=175774 RepID=A0A556U4I2_BAGYA|nr:hypothetical protein Baya_8631 [Bagarius yarrelli]
MAKVIALANIPFAIVCSPFCICTIVLNVFYIFCIWKPTVGVNLRQPLYFLLAAVLGNSTVQQLLTMISIVLCFSKPPEWVLIVNIAIILQAFGSSFSINAWISIFYYMKIVPHHNKPFIWVKNNIKGIIFAGFVFDQTLLMSALAIGAAAYLTPLAANDLNRTKLIGIPIVNGGLYKVCSGMILAYLICPLFTLLLSWGRTFFYLRRHIRRMNQTTSFSSPPQQRNHVRVTITGIVQTALFLPSSLYALIMTLLFTTLYDTLDSDKHITITITSMSNMANIVCLGFSQSVFRLRVIALLKKLKNALCSGDQK